jgi:LysR family nitrogen assimilation transcriptional regulator
LRYFVTIVDSGSITRAATAAGIAQSALSQQLAILENELRVKLLERSASGISPTTAGRTLYAYAQTILRQYDELRAAVHHSVQPLSGTVILGISPTMVRRFGLPLIERVCNQHPEMHLQIVEEGSAVLNASLAGGRIELSISPTRPEGAIAGEELLTERLALVHAASWDVASDASLAVLADLPWVVTRRPHSIRILVDAVFAASNLAPRVVIEIDSLPNVIETINRGFGCTVLPEGLIRSESDSCTVVSKPFGTSPVMRPMYLSYRRSPALTPAAKFVLDVLREIGAELRGDQ